MNPGGRVCSKLRSCHCTPTWVTERDSVSRKTKMKTKTKPKERKVNMVRIYNGILCSHKKDEFMSFAGTWMKLEAIILSKLTQEQKTKHLMFSLIGEC